MIIVKQNKEDIVNFSRVAEIKIIDYVAQKEVLEDKLGDIFASILKANVGIDNTKLSGYAIYAYFEKNNWNVLGEYKTEERAKEVLREIMEFWKNGAMTDYKGFICYEMPED
jgi:hypothetical protein